MASPRIHIPNLNVWLDLLESRLKLYLQYKFIAKQPLFSYSWFSKKMEIDVFAMLLFSEKSTLENIISDPGFEKLMTNAPLEKAALKEALVNIFQGMQKEPDVLASLIFDNASYRVTAQQAINLGSICQDLLAGNSKNLARIIQNSAMFLVLMSKAHSLFNYQSLYNPNPGETELTISYMHKKVKCYRIVHPELVKEFDVLGWEKSRLG